MKIDRSKYWKARQADGRLALALRKHRAAHPGLHYEQIKAWRKANPVKNKAHNIVNCAIKRGTLKRLACEQCGNIKSHAHHSNYAKPYEITWLCAVCHRQAHRI